MDGLRYGFPMKRLLLLAMVFGLASCNTSIGLWRDAKAVTNWSAKKIQNATSGGASTADQEYQYGAPVY